MVTDQALVASWQEPLGKEFFPFLPFSALGLLSFRSNRLAELF